MRLDHGDADNIPIDKFQNSKIFETPREDNIIQNNNRRVITSQNKLFI